MTRDLPKSLRYALLCVLTLVAYWPALRGEFIWDDYMFIVDNQLVRQAGGLAKIWFSTESTDYWPVSYTVFWALWRAFGPNTLGYHLVNVGVHVLNAGLIWSVLSELRVPAAYLTALLFAVHPVNVESVAWIFQLKTTLAATWAFASLWLWVRNRPAASFVAFALGLLTKTSIITWPFALALSSVRARGRLERRDVRRLVPFFALAFGLGVLNLIWYRYDHLHGGERVRTDHGIERVLIAARAFWFYVGRAVVPRDLAFVYPRWTVTATDGSAWLAPLGCLAFAAALGAHAWRTRSATAPLLLAAFVAVALFPVLGFADVYFFRFSFVADHYQYLAVAGTLTALAYVLHRIGRGAGALIVIVFTALTFAQARIYVDEETVWRDTLAKNPGAWLAQYDLGNVLYARGRLDEALGYYEGALANKPDYADAMNGAGAIHLARNDEATARLYFERALATFPDHARALNNLAALSLRHGEGPRAAEYLERATRALPDYLTGWTNLGIVYAQLGARENARRAFTRALALRPDDPDLRARLTALGP